MVLAEEGTKTIYFKDYMFNTDSWVIMPRNKRH